VENAKEIWEIMAQRSPAPMLELVMNHGSFAQTIENIFALSFLVRFCVHTCSNHPQRQVLHSISLLLSVLVSSEQCYSGWYLDSHVSC